jgi:hypothetical protein
VHFGFGMQAKDDKERYKTEMADYTPPAGSKSAKSTSTGTKKAAKKKKDPNAPKRNMSSFMFFSNEIRSTLKEEQPDLSFGEIVSIRQEAEDIFVLHLALTLPYLLYHRVRRLEQNSGLCQQKKRSHMRKRPRKLRNATRRNWQNTKQNKRKKRKMTTTTTTMMMVLMIVAATIRTIPIDLNPSRAGRQQETL